MFLNETNIYIFIIYFNIIDSCTLFTNEINKHIYYLNQLSKNFI